MQFSSKYIAKLPDSNGFIDYSDEENAVWKTLYERQYQLVAQHACEEYLHGLEYLQFEANKIPQLPEVTSRLQQATGWSVAPVEALISAKAFFNLLAKRHFPAATFIRTPEDLDYVTEPDIFHELFGHCPMLVEPVFADFVQEYAEQVLKYDEKHWPLLQRFFWFTVEFGLIKKQNKLRAYGGGILSSISETVYSVESDLPQRRLFNPLDIFRTPYRIDMLQTVYFVLDDYQQLFDFVKSDIKAVLDKAYQLGEYPPTFPIEKDDDPSVHIACC